MDIEQISGPKIKCRRRPPSALVIALYLIAIVVANLSVAAFGQIALVFTGLFLIPFDFVARDVLHGRWKNKLLWPRIFGLIIAGAVITVALNWSARNVAMASVAAFGFGVIINTGLYQLLDGVERMKRMNITNAIVSFVDSFLFPALAFGTIDWTIVVWQNVIKALGAVVWAYLVVRVWKIT